MGDTTPLRGRGRLSSIELMPSECDGIIAWAAGELSDRERTQIDIYADFVDKCEALMAEHRGELEFTIPAFSSFNRYAVKQARLTRRLDQTRQIVAALAERHDPADADNLTIMASETVKSLVLHLLADADEDSIDPKGVMQLATALRQAAAAQGISSDRRRKVEADFAKKAEAAVTAVAKAKGLSTETVEAIMTEVLGVTK